MPLPTQVTSKILLVETLRQVQEYLLSNPKTPIELLFDIQLALDYVCFDNNPEEYWSRWLMIRGNTDLKSFSDAKSLFMSGFNFCQEQFEYEFGLEC